MKVQVSGLPSQPRLSRPQFLRADVGRSGNRLPGLAEAPSQAQAPPPCPLPAEHVPGPGTAPPPRPPRDRGVSHTCHARGGHHVGEGWVPRWPCGHTPTKGTSSAQGPRTPRHPGPRGTEDVAPSRWKEQGALALPGGALEAGAAARNSRPRTQLPRQRMRSVAVSWKLHPADAPRGSVKILNLLGGKWKKPDRAVQPGQGARQGADAISRPRLARD